MEALKSWVVYWRREKSCYMTTLPQYKINCEDIEWNRTRSLKTRYSWKVATLHNHACNRVYINFSNMFASFTFQRLAIEKSRKSRVSYSNEADKICILPSDTYKIRSDLRRRADIEAVLIRDMAKNDVSTFSVYKLLAGIAWQKWRKNDPFCKIKIHEAKIVAYKKRVWQMGWIPSFTCTICPAPAEARRATVSIITIAPLV